MKKTILILVALALVVPTAAMAATEFSLGGFIKLETMWDSSNVNKDVISKIFRDNDPLNRHGRFREVATFTRINFTIKGPKLWGAQVTGFIEADWDATGGNVPPNAAESADTGAFRLRHAMFRLNWPETQLLIGQYWSFLSEFSPEVAQDSGFQFRGAFSRRLAQISITQKFLGAWTAGFLVGTPRLGTSLEPTVGTASQDERAETPYLEAKLRYEQDLWGKAAYYRKPQAFTAQVAAAWQRTNIAAVTRQAATTWGQNSYGDFATFVTSDHMYVNHWSVQGTLFIPVIPTPSANLAGTAAILTQWSIGQGQSFVGATWATDDAFYQVRNLNPNGTIYDYDRILTPSLTGWVQAQYYFTNDWFLTTVWGYMRKYGLGFDRVFPGGPFNYATVGQTAQVNGGNNDLTKYSNQITTTLWYRPIEAIKFGLGYTYTRDVYFQKTGYTVAGAFTGNTANSSQFRDVGENHRLEFVGIYYF
ncbi:MAG TPA: hypothetical protein VGA79_08380 [Desulfobaccales bacterium]